MEGTDALVHENELPFFIRRQAATGLRKLTGIAQMTRSLLRIGQVETQASRDQTVEQRGFFRSVAPRTAVDIGTVQLGLEFTGEPTSYIRLRYIAFL